MGLLRQHIWPPDVPWSYSALETFESCGLMYGEMNHLNKKSYPFVETASQKQGNQLHKLLEDYVTLGSALPPGLLKIKNIIDKMMAGAVEVQAEQSLNLTYWLEPCNVFHGDVSYRGKLDLTVLHKNGRAITVDYKSSSEPRENMDQLEFAGVASLLHNPGVTELHCYYLYTKGFNPRKIVLKREDIMRVATAVRPRLDRLEEARRKRNYVATPCYRCKWCPVVKCSFNPRRG